MCTTLSTFNSVRRRLRLALQIKQPVLSSIYEQSKCFITVGTSQYEYIYSMGLSYSTPKYYTQILCLNQAKDLQMCNSCQQKVERQNSDTHMCGCVNSFQSNLHNCQGAFVVNGHLIITSLFIETVICTKIIFKFFVKAV